MTQIVKKTGIGYIDTSDGAWNPQGITVYGKTMHNLWRNTTQLTNSGVTISVVSGGAVKLSGTATANARLYAPERYILRGGRQYTVKINKALPDDAFFFIECRDQDGNGDYYYFGGNDKGKPKNLTVTFTTPNEISYCYLALAVNEGVTVSGLYFITLSEGSAAESWSPVGINGITQIYLSTSGKNLWGGIADGTDFGVSLVTNPDQTITVSGTATGNGTVAHSVNHSLEVGKTYRLRCKRVSDTGEIPNRAAIQVTTYATNALGTQVNYYGTPCTKATNYDSSITFTLSDHESVIVFQFYVNAGVTVSGTYQITLVEDGQSTDWEPSSYSEIAIDLQGNTLCSLPDGTCDELVIDKYGNATITKRIAEVVVNEDDLIPIATEYAEANLEDDYLGGVDYAINRQVNDFAITANAYIVSGYPKCAVYTRNTGARFRIGNGIYESSAQVQVDNLKAIIPSKGIRVIYALKYPKTIDLGKINIPRINDRLFVSSVVAAEVSVDYYKRALNGDGVAIGYDHSFYSDLNQCIESRDTGTPEKKLITKTVPYMSGFYDFSKLYGSIPYESRELQYSFGIIGDREEVQAQKSKLLNWLNSAHDADIYDDDIQGWHFHGSLSDTEWEEDESGESGTLTATFLCHPFMIADDETEKSLSVGSSTVIVEGQAVNPYASVSSGSATITIGGIKQSVSTTPVRLSSQLQPGENSVTVTGQAVKLTYREQKL